MGKQTSPEGIAERLLICHEDGGSRCATAHWQKGNRDVLLGQCISCRHCGKWIRPENMNERCPKRES